MVSVFTFALSGPESVFGLTGIGTSLAGGCTTWADAVDASAYKIAPTTRPGRAKRIAFPPARISELSRGRIR